MDGTSTDFIMLRFFAELLVYILGFKIRVRIEWYSIIEIESYELCRLEKRKIFSIWIVFLFFIVHFWLITLFSSWMNPNQCRTQIWQVFIVEFIFYSYKLTIDSFLNNFDVKEKEQIEIQLKKIIKYRDLLRKLIEWLRILENHINGKNVVNYKELISKFNGYLSQMLTMQGMNHLNHSNLIFPFEWWGFDVCMNRI